MLLCDVNLGSYVGKAFMDYTSIKKLARGLRKRQTRAEIYFWEKVRDRRFMKLKFNRQFVIGYGL